ncbi:MAG TPA: tRNA pseudouridine(55) synthase TruB [bacterium]|nr:tRNA pseudouridine(55) synthase TruB [bacterium]
MDGVLCVLKPPGMTSHDVVDVVRRLVGLRRVGHTGTLDPGAAGVLVCCLGRATRLSEFLTDADKEYRVELRLGMSTDSGDAYGAPLPPPDLAAAARAVPRAELDAVLRRFTGEIQQVPPMVSAIHHEGTRLYRLARKGEVVDREARQVSIYRIDVLDASPDGRTVLLHVSCGKGTYIRKLCADIGEALGVGGYAHFMVRTRAGQFELEDAVTLDELAALAARGALADVVHPMDRAVSHLPAVDLPDRSVSDVLHGHPVPVWKLGDVRVSEDSPVRLRSRRGALIALARVEEGVLRPFKVLGGPEGGAVAHRARPR